MVHLTLSLCVVLLLSLFDDSQGMGIASSSTWSFSPGDEAVQRGVKVCCPPEMPPRVSLGEQEWLLWVCRW